MSQVKPFSAITESNIQDWKAQKGDLKQIDVIVSYKETEEETQTDDGSRIEVTAVPDRVASFVVCKPTRTVVDLIGEKNTKRDNVGANRALVSNCVLGGDMDELEADGSVYQSVLEQLAALVAAKTSSIKNL